MSPTHNTKKKQHLPGSQPFASVITAAAILSIHQQLMNAHYQFYSFKFTQSRIDFNFTTLDVPKHNFAFSKITLKTRAMRNTTAAVIYFLLIDRLYALRACLCCV